jgi:hypothetical protein
MNTIGVKDQDVAVKIMAEKETFQKQSATNRKVWAECMKAYDSKIEAQVNPYLSNLFIPKTHEAVEYLASYFAGINQVVIARPETGADVNKARVAAKLLDFQWRKELKARIKVATWIKQCLLFSDGIMKAGWDVSEEQPFITPLNLPDVYFDYFTPNIQDSPIIHKLTKFKSAIEKDTRYKKAVVKDLVAETDVDYDNEFDKTESGQQDTGESNDPKITYYEYWSTDNEVITVGKTSFGYQVMRRIKNEYVDADNQPYKPFVKIVCKNSPLANRAYNIGAIEPTLKIQKAFNDAVNEFFDNASLVNNKQWIKRRGASINPGDLVRRPGGIITVDDINKDIKSEETSDIKGSMMEMINFLDSEFQQASMVVNLMKGIGGGGLATEAVMGQQNIFNLFDSVNQNIQDGMSELGQMILDLDMQYMTKKKTIQILDSEEKTVFADIDKGAIKGKYAIQVSADRKDNQNKAVKQKQLLEFLGTVAQDQVTLQQYPNLPQKIYKKWLEEAGFTDSDYFFDEAKKVEGNVDVSQTQPKPLKAPKEMGPMSAEQNPLQSLLGANKAPVATAGPVEAPASTSPVEVNKVI